MELPEVIVTVSSSASCPKVSTLLSYSMRCSSVSTSPRLWRSRLTSKVASYVAVPVSRSVRRSLTLRPVVPLAIVIVTVAAELIRTMNGHGLNAASTAPG